MSPELRKVWMHLSFEIEPFCPESTTFIRKYIDDPECEGFSLTNDESKLKIIAYMHEPIWQYFPLESEAKNDKDS
jgi:hypothetical protein